MLYAVEWLVINIRQHRITGGPMRFKDDKQLSRVCSTLLAQLKMEDLWTEEGPTPSAIQLQKANGGPLSHGERTWLAITWAIWTGENEFPLTFSEAINTLDAKRLAVLGSLLQAFPEGDASIERWIRYMTRSIN